MAKTAASLALGGSRPGCHATMSLDSFMKGTDAMYQSSPGVKGQSFVRKMATYGRSRPSNVFTAESRQGRPFLGKEATYDMSNEQATFNDPRADPRELSLEYPAPPNVDMSFLAFYENHGLMVPSERFREFIHTKKGEEQWRADREAIFLDKKRHFMIERHHKQGVVGIDGPGHEGTKLFAGIRSVNERRRAKSLVHSTGRQDHLGYQMQSSDTVALRNYGEPPPPDMARSADIPVQRKNIDPDVHPFRFLDTHDRINPTDVPYWDIARSQTLRSHEVRNKKYNIISGTELAV